MDAVHSRRSILLFSDRLKIEELYLDWVKKNGIADKPNSVVAFLQVHNWLNEEKIIEDLDFMDLMRKE